MQEDYQVVPSAAFGVMKANLAKFRETVFDSEFWLRSHGDDAHQLAVWERALQAETLRVVVSNINFHSQERSRKRLPLGIGHQRKRAASAKAFVQQKIEGAEVRQLKSFDIAFADAGEMVFHSVSGHFAHKDRIKLIAQGDQPDVCGVAFITRARVRQSG
jgi:hypothetical protein